MKPTEVFPEIQDNEDAPLCDEIISQASLVAFLVAKKALKNAQAAYDICRLKLLQQHQAGAPNEPGKWILTVEQLSMRILSREKLTAAIGLETYELLLAAVEPTAIDRVGVKRNKSHTHHAPHEWDKCPENHAGEMEQIEPGLF